jgi:hypothetical protein
VAGTATPIFPQTIKNYVATILPADTTTVKSVAVGGSNGTRIESFIIVSSDSADRDLLVYITISATNYLIGTVKIPLTSGTVNTIPGVDILRSASLYGLATDVNGNRYLYLASGSTLSIATSATVTTAKQITAFAQGGDY